MSLGEETRLSVLDGVLDEQLNAGPGLVDGAFGQADGRETMSTDLFAVVDLLGSSPVLRRAVSDPGVPEKARQQLVHAVLDGKISKPAVKVVAEAVVQRWPGSRTMLAAIERQAVRAEFFRAESAGQLEETEDELFRFARLVASDDALRGAVSDRSVPLVHRQQLVSDVLSGKAGESTIRLARRAVVARERSFDNTIEGYVTLAAEQKNRLIATVRVARSLTAEQVSRLEQVLSRQVGRSVFVQVVVDPDVIGGARVELGDEVIEGTVAAKLEGARRLFSS
jgi:F-type H+-transporting ATPase subunit delta